MEACSTITQQQVETFLGDGVLVVENVLTPEELKLAHEGLARTLATEGVDCCNLRATGHGLRYLSSTNGSGGVLDIFYEPWRLSVATNPRLFRITTQLWRAAYCNQHPKEDLAEGEQYKWHPYEAFDPSRGYAYVDRIGYRLNSDLAKELGGDPPPAVASSTPSSTATANKSKKKKRPMPLQRSLTPHLDCCPDNLFDNTKWRPIQSFVSLTDNLEPSTGGFEAAKGFHHDFDSWARNRPPSVFTRKDKASGQKDTVSVPAPCLGEYTHIRPREDAAVMQRVQHVPVRAGSAVFWDYRIPHANAYQHTGTVPRAVVYASFLPDIAVNRQYAAQQLDNWQRGRNPADQWIHSTDDNLVPAQEAILRFQEQTRNLSQLGRRLLTIEPWQ